jgi:hypothetical protein
MLKPVSTAEFFTFLVLLTCIYYVVVLIKYYNEELKSFCKGQFKKQTISGSPPVIGAAIVPTATIETGEK